MNFATMDWLPVGSKALSNTLSASCDLLIDEALERYRMFARESVFSTQRLLFTVLKYKSEFHHDRKKYASLVTYLLEE